MENNLCIKCNKKPIQIKKWGLCTSCYQSGWRDGLIPKKEKQIKNPEKILDKIKTVSVINKYEKLGEFDFIKNFFNHFNWIHQPAIFYLDGFKYTPDFYDEERNVFIEVSRTRQSYSANKYKYDLFRKLYPKLNFEIRKPSGDLLDETTRNKEWEQ